MANRRSSQGARPHERNRRSDCCRSSAERPDDRIHLPGYEDYGRFLAETLKPLIDAKYRALPGPTDTAVMGSSLGGVVSFYLAWRWPEIFGKAACLSSTFTYRDNLLERVAEEPKRDLKIYLDSGWPGDNYEATPGYA